MKGLKGILTLTLLFALSLGITACNNGGSKDKASGKETIKIGVSEVPHGEIVNALKDEFAKEGLDVQTVVFDEYTKPNLALNDKELDANYFQHKPFFEKFSKEHNLKLEILGYVHIEPMGVYSKKYKTLDEIPEGSEILIPNDVSNGARALLFLEQKGLIKLKDSQNYFSTEKDIVENKKNLKFTPLDATGIPRAYVDVAAGVINANYALTAGLNPVKESIALEDLKGPYQNLVAVREGEKNQEKFKKLIKVLNSEACKKFIEEKYKNAVLPVFK